MAIVIYTTQTCPYCDQAKRLLERKQAHYRGYTDTVRTLYSERQDTVQKLY